MTLVDSFLYPIEKRVYKLKPLKPIGNRGLVNSMEVNFLKFQTFLAKVYRIENLTYVRTNEVIWLFLFVERNVPYSYDHDKTKECE